MLAQSVSLPDIVTVTCLRLHLKILALSVRLPDIITVTYLWLHLKILALSVRLLDIKQTFSGSVTSGITEKRFQAASEDTSGHQNRHVPAACVLRYQRCPFCSLSPYIETDTCLQPVFQDTSAVRSAVCRHTSKQTCVCSLCYTIALSVPLIRGMSKQTHVFRLRLKIPAAMSVPLFVRFQIRHICICSLHATKNTSAVRSAACETSKQTQVFKLRLKIPVHTLCIIQPKIQQNLKQS